jgi:ketosteroid isomerase-like protein
MPPTGKHVSAPFAMVHEVRDGKLAASRCYYDQLEFLAQLGVLPEGAPA